MSKMLVTPKGIWYKLHIYTRNNRMYGVLYSCVAGNPEIFQLSVDLKPIARAVVDYHNRLHEGDKVEGFFDDVAKVVKDVGRSKLVKGIARTAKDVVRSKITAGVVSAMAVAIPPVGVPAAAAYATANTALQVVDQAEAAKKALEDAGSVANKAINAAKKYGADKVKQVINSNPSVRAKLLMEQRKLRSEKSKLLRERNKLSKAAKTRNSLAKQLAKRPSLKHVKIDGVWQKTPDGHIYVKRKLNDPRAKDGYKLQRENVVGTYYNKKTKKDNHPLFKKIREQAIKENRTSAAKTPAEQEAANRQLAKFNSEVAIINRKLKSLDSQIKEKALTVKKKRPVKKTPITKASAMSLIDKASIIKKKMSDIAMTAKYSDDPVKKLNALKAAKIFNIVAQNRARQSMIAEQFDQAPESGTMGLLINPRGKLIPGKYMNRGILADVAPSTLLTSSKKIVPGSFARVSGCEEIAIGCGCE